MSLRGLTNTNSSVVNCHQYSSCSTCIDSDSCEWCSSSGACFGSAQDDSQCSVDPQSSSCNEDTYALICFVIASLCFAFCILCYWRRIRTYCSSSNPVGTLTSMGGSLSRSVVWRKPRPDDDWLCVICGADNSDDVADCLLCGTSRRFTAEYKQARKDRAATTAPVAVIAELLESDGQEPPSNSAAGLTDEQRQEAFNFRRLNQVFL